MVCNTTSLREARVRPGGKGRLSTQECWLPAHLPGMGAACCQAATARVHFLGLCGGRSICKQRHIRTIKNAEAAHWLRRGVGGCGRGPGSTGGCSKPECVMTTLLPTGGERAMTAHLTKDLGNNGALLL